VKQQGDWVRVLASSRLECDLASAVLESHGIETINPGGTAEMIGAVFEPSELWVRAEVADRAREIIEQAKSSGT
jgi:hypothetical protein